MENLELAKLVYKQVTEFPETFNMTIWGQRNKCGTSACLAGHAMLFSGYELTGGGAFVRPDGTAVVSNSAEAIGLLGLSPGEYYGESDWGLRPLFATSNANAVRRLGNLIAKQEGYE